MRLIVEICGERELPAIINIHDVVLAQAFTRRIIGLQNGRVVFDGPSDQLDEAALTQIYGEEDWTQMTRPPAAGAGGGDHADERELEERLAGLS